jgi:hypothetical protein
MGLNFIKPIGNKNILEKKTVAVKLFATQFIFL